MAGEVTPKTRGREDRSPPPSALPATPQTRFSFENRVWVSMPSRYPCGSAVYTFSPARIGTFSLFSAGVIGQDQFSL